MLWQGKKACSVCKKVLPTRFFTKSASSFSGYASLCRDCNKAVSKEYYRKQRESFAKYRKSKFTISEFFLKQDEKRNPVIRERRNKLMRWLAEGDTDEKLYWLDMNFEDIYDDIEFYLNGKYKSGQRVRKSIGEPDIELRY